MSYIRCTSNPESLYIYESTENVHDFSWVDRDGKFQHFSIPSDDFDEFFIRLKKWQEHYDLCDEVFECKGIRVQEVIYGEYARRVITDEENNELHRRIFGKLHDPSGSDTLICLTYKNFEPLLMWYVTWWHVLDGVYYNYGPGRFRRWLIRVLGGRM